MCKTDNRMMLSRVWQSLVQKPLVLIIGLSLTLRLAVAFAMGDVVVELPGIFDQISYHNLALRVMNGYGFSFGELWWPVTPANAPTAHWSFLYTLYLTGIYLIFGPHPIAARVVQVVIVGILHPYIAYRICEKIFRKETALITAVITAIYIYFIYYGAALMTEPFYITAILFSLYFSLCLAESREHKRDMIVGVALGVSIGIALLLRQVFLLFLPFLLGWIWFVRLRQAWKPPTVALVIVVVIIVVSIAPVTVYNYARFGRFVLLNTNSGYAFFWGNHPIYGTRFVPILPTAQYQSMIPEEIRHLDEAALDQELLRRGLQFVRDDPGRYLLLSLSRIPPYFMFWYSSDSSPLSNISRMGSFGLFLPFMLYGLFLGVRKHDGFWNLLFSREGLLMLFAVVYSGVHILTWTLIRYRLPVDAVLIPFAGVVLNRVAEWVVPIRHRLVTK